MKVVVSQGDPLYRDKGHSKSHAGTKNGGGDQGTVDRLDKENQL